jgi:hypothetical protein
MPKAVRARLELRDGAGRVTEETVDYNAPLSSGGGARLALLADLGRIPIARIASGSDSCALAEGQGCEIGGEPLALLGFAPGRGGRPAALVRARGPSGGVEVRAVALDAELALPGGGTLHFAALSREPAVLLRTREAPGNPWALAASIFMAAGVALLWRKLAR